MKYFLIILLNIFSIASFGQVPQKMSYQAVIRDANNNLLSLKDISMRISIIKGEFEPHAVYIETHLGKTNLNGLVSLQIGTGDILMGQFSQIDWSNGPYYIYTETDPYGGFDYSITGKSELLSVPFAMYSANSKNSFDTTYMNNKIINLQNQSIENKNNIQNNLDSIIANAKQIKLNVDNIQNNTSSIKNNLDTLNTKISTVDFNSLIAGYQKIGQFVTAISLEGIDSFDIKINGNLTASKTVTVGGNIEALGSTSTLGTLEKPFKGLFISSGSLSIASDTLGLNVPAAVLSNIRGNLEISAGGLKLVGTDQALVAPRIISTLTGNASSATKLETARTINGVSFNGTSNIIIPSTTSNNISFNNVGTGDASGVAFDGSVAKTISYNSIGAAPLAGSTLITTVGNITSGSIPFSLLTGIVPIWNQSTTGNAATVTTNANLTGVVTSIGNITNINNSSITNAMLTNASVANLTGVNSGDETIITLKNKLGVTILNGDNSGDETTNTIKTKLGISILSGDNTGDESTTSIKSKLGITTLSGSNTGDQINITGNAGTATKLAASKTINGVAFDGSTNIIIASASANALTFSNTGLGDVSGGTYDGSLAKILSYNSIGAVASNTAITGATKTKLTYDAKGLVTAGTDATTADIAASTNKNYVTDAQVGVLSNTSGTNTGDESAATIKTKLGITTLSGSNTGDQINITGNAATVTTNANLTGDITSIGNTTSIGLLKVTNEMIAVSTIDITAKVTGTLPIANGGTNSTATPTAGGINFGTGTAQAYTAAGTSGQYLRSAAAGTPVWGQPGPASVQILTTGTTYNTPTDVKAIMVELLGGGGGSGAIIETGGANKGSASGGGGSGSYTRKLIVSPASSYSYIIGTAGAGGTAGGVGGNGGQTSFNGSAITAPGGNGGGGCATATQYVVSTGGIGGVAGTGDFTVNGNAGGTGIVVIGMSICGAGANSIFGDGPLANATVGAMIGPNAATGYGAGASGVSAYATAVSSANGAGAAGFQGVIIVTEYK